MNTQFNTLAIEARVNELVRTFSANDACVASLLCDRHPSQQTAYRIVGTDGQTSSLSYGTLKMRSEKLASGFAKLGYGPGDRIATLMSKGEDYLVVLMAVWRLGAVYVPLFTAFARGAVEMRLEASGTRLVICDNSQRSKIEGLAGEVFPYLKVANINAPCGEDLSLQEIEASGESEFPAFVTGGNGSIIEIYTSGTTGKPKGVIVPLRAFAGFQAYGEFGLGLVEDDVYWNAADPGWAYGLYFGVITSLTTGVTSIIHTEKFSPKGTQDVLRNQGVTNFTAAPTVYRSLRAHGVGSSTFALRCASSAGEPLTPDVNEWAPKALGVEVHDHFGQTEAGMLVNNHHHPDLKTPIKPGSMGWSSPGWQMTVIDGLTHEELGPGQSGLLAARLSESPFAWFTGYASVPEKSAERLTPCGQWYLTGDVAKYDVDGSFRFSARDDDVIIMAGYRIGPFDIESVISTHPAVREVAVVAAPDDIRGEVLEAVVVLVDGYEPSDALSDEIKTKVRNDYATYAYPRRVHYRDGMPKTPSGKVQRFILRQELHNTKKDTK